MVWRGVIDTYREFLPVNENTPVVTLLEGNTPLVPARKLGKLGGGSRDLGIFLKYEGLNPTGSFKDRGMTVAISKAVEKGSRAVMCASTGNTSASAAAYSARAGITCVVAVPEGAIALGKLAQAHVHGAKVLAVKGNFDQALSIVREMTSKHPITLVNSINPDRVEGQKTAAFEVCDQLGRVPDYLAIPVGNAGNITAYWKGFKDYAAAGRIPSLPRMLGFQAEGAAPIVECRVIEKPATIATAIRIGNPASWQGAVRARDESGGLITKVSDAEIMDAYRILAEEEGVFVEPASAASVAGLLKLGKAGFFEKGSTIVCVLTGHGLKDPERSLAQAPQPIAVSPDLREIEEVVLG